ncbi:MAG: SurA N-terminal domain-containing protein [Maritimibacter sp.]|nr:SurA N-terminal domain-containing protein [Maritimibacter sp.]
MSMSQNKIARGAVWIIMALVLVGLIGFGSFNFGGSSSSIGRVGETEISANRYYREVNAQLNAIEQQFGQRLPFSQAQMFGVDQQALSTVLSQVALENETARLGISVGDQELAGRIRDISAFAGPDGAFDRATYDFVLQQSGLTASEFEESLRSEVARTILQDAVAGGVASQPAFVRTLYAWARETRDLTWARVDATALEAPVGLPDDAQLTAFYEAHPEDYTTPETKKLTYAWLRPEDVLDQVEVSEEKIQKAYEDRSDEFRKPERRLVERLVYGNDAEAADAAQRLTDGTASFEDLVAERGLDLADIDLGDVTEADLGPAGSTVFALEGPGTTAVVTTDFGPAIFRVNAVLAAQETSLADATPTLRDDLARDGARGLLADLATQIDDALAGGATIEDLAGEFGVTVAQLDWTGAEQDGIAAYDTFRAAADAVTEDDYPQVEHLADNGLFALRLDEIVAPALQPLDAVRDAAVADWQADETTARIQARAAVMATELASGQTPDALGLAPTLAIATSRDSQIEGASAAMVEAAFTAGAGAWTKVDTDDGALLFRVDAIHEADQDSEAAMAAKSGFADQTAESLSQDIQAAFAAALETQAGITLDQAMIAAVNAQFQ